MYRSICLKRLTVRMRECIQSVSKYIKGWKFVSVSLSHYRILVPASLLTHVITKNSYKVNLHYVRRSCAAAELHD